MENKLYNSITSLVLAGALLLPIGCREACQKPKGLEEYLANTKAYEPTKKVVKAIYENPEEVRKNYPEVFEKAVNPYDLTLDQLGKIEQELPWELVKNINTLRGKYSPETMLKETGIKLDTSTITMIQYQYASDNFSLGML